jgi:hypothetical protein
MIARSPAELRSAMRLEAIHPDDKTLDELRAAIAESGLLLLGEPHGVQETPGLLYALATALDARTLAFEWSHEEFDEVVQAFVRTGRLDLERLWTLPASAELFAGDGRITAGHFALLERLRAEGRLDGVILFDRLDPEPEPADWRPRDRDMAARLLAEWNGHDRLLALTGGFHAQLEPDTMAAHLARELPLRPATIHYARGRCWSRGEAREIEGPPPTAPITIVLPEATPATVPGL